MFLTYIVPLSILLPILFGLLYYQNSTPGSKLLFYYLIASGSINLTAILLVANGVKNNLPLLHLYTIVEAVFILSYLRTLFLNNLTQKILLIITILFPILCIINFTFIQSIFTFNTYTRPLEAILITFFCLLFLYQSGFTENWLKKPSSWFNVGILIYFPVVCIIFIVSNYIVFVAKDKNLNTLIWEFHGAMSLLMYVFWAKGFSLIKQNG